VDDRTRTYDSQLALYQDPPWCASVRNRDQLGGFDEANPTCRKTETAPIRLRVPSVLFFIGNEGPESDSLICDLDKAHAQFGKRSVQLLVIINEKPSLASLRLNLTVPILGDNGLGELFLLQTHDRRAHAAVILGNDGRLVSVQHTFPFLQPVLTLLERIDRLRVRLPRLFCSNHLLRL
jgi:hypothetical protein